MIKKYLYDDVHVLLYQTYAVLSAVPGKQGKECKLTKSSEQGIHIDCDEFVKLGTI